MSEINLYLCFRLKKYQYGNHMFVKYRDEWKKIADMWVLSCCGTRFVTNKI